MKADTGKSLSARRAWIEISRAANCQHRSHVALRKESVDRNSTRLASSRASTVALRKESVDRNVPGQNLINGIGVALRKESVDRNDAVQIVVVIVDGRSPQGERG